MNSVFQVADYFLNKASKEEDGGEIISNLKLQKLVYYAQGFHLAMYNQPLYTESLEAWTHGPVCPDLYHDKKKYKNGAVEPNTNFDASVFSKEQKDLLDEIYEVYGQFSAWKLRNLTHEEAPWKDNLDNDNNNLISHEDLKKYFKTQLN
ncbi:TPA: Panacea domain-containing protein [Legionella pneumophila]|uniref:DUF4065 domain-containing protein n=3 Tax=Legionella TaxID=445 RepID=A0A2S6EV38_LEGPN|nr:MULTISPECIES: type II toxin-antitoxin system antitoxin SocA domain-containing protein [Legionella]APF04291.1 hypothetical protein BIZ52_13405 [Legionella pneumophila subsp. fraseri]APF07273.1 hypothetical protein BIZ51_13285 [Legionella pneumophila subsp. fraseri]AUB69730.1 hypothetical protein BJK09_13200 [Legionella pneumophila]AUB72705.1 hypothetical protein BJK08_13195 [Legionella pneumophila]KTC94287.1 hypothetical protein Lery_2454 [Legionella erythra]